MAAARIAARSDTIPSVRRLTTTIATAAVLLLTFAPSAFAFNDGRGFYGETNDLVITKVGFMLIIFFPLFVLFATLLQHHLEKRKDAQLAAARRRATSEDWHGGW